MAGGGGWLRGTSKCYLHSTKANPRTTAPASSGNEASEKGETAKRIPIVKLNACTDNDQSEAGRECRGGKGGLKIDRQTERV